MPTATFTVWDALAAVITGEAVGPQDSDGDDLLNTARVYRGMLPPGEEPDLSYFLLGQRSEDEGGYYNRRGHLGTYRVHCWSTTPDNAGRLYAWLHDLVHDERLGLADHDMVVGGKLRWVSEQPDPDGSAWQVIADYVVETVEE